MNWCQYWLVVSNDVWLTVRIIIMQLLVAALQLWKIEYAYHTRILFFEEYVRILTYSIIAYAYARALQATHNLTSKVLTCAI